MVGQSFEVAVLALIEALSTADVTALTCSVDPLVCAIAPPQSTAEAKPISKELRKKRPAKSTCGVSRVIISSQWSLMDLRQSYARAKRRVNQRRRVVQQRQRLKASSRSVERKDRAASRLKELHSRAECASRTNQWCRHRG